MNRIIHVHEIHQLASPTVGKKLVIGGCFDILHIGHISFLNKAKEYGDTLIALLESDESVRKWKGQNRPIHTQNERAEILAGLRMVDYVILLPEMKGDEEYDELIRKISPAIIVTTEGDKGLIHKVRQAKLTQSELVQVPLLPEKSSSRILKLLSQEL